MVSTVALDNAIRTLSKEMANDKDVSLIGKTEAEKDILAHYATSGRRRGALGALCGSALMAGLWKLSKSKKKVAAAFAMISGGLFGASYGIISIRRDFFSDLLMLPSDKSPFATRARTILQTKIPDNPFVQELNDKFKRSAAAMDSWDQESLGSSLISLPSNPRRYDSAISDSIPPIVGLDTQRDERNLSEENHEAFDEPKDSARRPLFFFGAKSQSTNFASESERQDVSLSYPDSNKNPSILRHDEDDYFFGVPNETETPTNPTTWAEIRSRATAERK